MCLHVNNVFCLGICDVQAAIVARKQELALEQQQLQAALDAGAASGIDPLDQPDIPPDIKASSKPFCQWCCQQHVPL